MRNFLDIKKIRYVLAFIFLAFIINPVSAGIIQDPDSVGRSASSGQNADSAHTQAAVIQNPDSIFNVKRTITAEDLIRGERLFFGLIYLDNKAVDCANCHNVRVSDTLNWNPDAAEISSKYRDKSAKDLSIVLLKPVGKKLAEVHKDFILSPEDIIMIKAYMDRVLVSGIKQNKPVITNLLLFIIAFVLLLFSMVDLMITKIVKRKWINYLILVVTSVFITDILFIDGLAIGHSQGYSPLQPVKFSHAVHAGQNKTDCIYCHSFVRRSKTAGFPPENVCMNCHLMVRTGTRSGVTEIAKVISAYENLKPIEWIKVHNLPDHVFFSHAQHVSAGGVACQECHGKVEEMNVIRQVKDLSMGWCINCHRTRKINFQNNKFYGDYEALADKLKSGGIDSVTVSMVGGTECMKCHY